MAATAAAAEAAIDVMGVTDLGEYDEPQAEKLLFIDVAVAKNK